MGRPTWVSGKLQDVYVAAPHRYPRAHPRAAVLIAWLCTTWPAVSRAQDTPAAPDPPASPQDASAEAAPPPPTEGAQTGDAGTVGEVPTAPARVVVHLDTGPEASLTPALREALQAQFTAVPAQLETREVHEPPGDMPARMRSGREAARRHGAFAVFWIEARPQQPWMLYMMDPSGDRLLARELPGEEATANASIEAAAVIVAGATGALLRGEPVELRIAAMAPPRQDATPPPPPPPPPPTTEAAPDTHATPAAPPPPPDTPARLRMWIGYHGQAVASELAWQEGIGASLALRPVADLWLGLAYVDAMTETVGEAARFELRRGTARVSAGYALSLGPLWIEPEAALAMEVVRRHSLPGDGGFDPRPDQTRIVWGLEPAVSVMLPLGESTGLRARLGSEIILNNFKYMTESPEARVELAPRVVQPSVELGLSLRF